MKLISYSFAIALAFLGLTTSVRADEFAQFWKAKGLTISSDARKGRESLWEFVMANTNVSRLDKIQTGRECSQEHDDVIAVASAIKPAKTDTTSGSMRGFEGMLGKWPVLFLDEPVHCSLLWPVQKPEGGVVQINDQTVYDLRTGKFATLINGRLTLYSRSGNSFTRERTIAISGI